MTPLKPMRIEKIATTAFSISLDARVDLGLLRLRGQDHLLPGRHRHPERHEQRDADDQPDGRARAALRMPQRVLGGQARREPNGRASVPTSRRAGGMTRSAANTMPVNDTMPPDQTDEHAGRVHEPDQDAEQRATRSR